MQRTTHSTRSVNLFGSGRDGYTDGVPGVTAATVLNSAPMNAIQEEVARAIEDSGSALSASVYDQLSRTLVGRTELVELLNMTAYDTGAANVIKGAALSTTGVLVLVGAGGHIYSSSDGGKTFAARTAGSSYTGDFYDVQWSSSPALFVACGDNGEIQTSPNGATWTRRNTGTGAFWSVQIGASFAVVAGDNGQTLWSATLTSWTSNTAINGGVFNPAKLAYNNAITTPCWLLAGSDGGADRDKTLWRSTNGTAWSAVDLTSVLPSGYAVLNVAARGTAGFVLHAADYLTGLTNKIYTSADGVTWTLAYSPTGSFAAYMTAGRTLVHLWTGTGADFYSYDAVTWYQLANPSVTVSPVRIQSVRTPLLERFLAHGTGGSAGKGCLSRLIPL